MVTFMTSPSPAAWLALADGGPVTELTSVIGPRTIHSTRDPREFASLLQSARPRIAILGTPPAGPDELEAALTERRRRSTLRVVVVCPTEAIAQRLHALRAGADEAHADTIDPKELGARLSILEERARSRHETVLVVTDQTEIDLVAHQVRRDGALIHLRPKEFQLLAMLAAHPGRAYSRRQLLDRVWGTHYDGDARTADVHIRWLRSKVEPCPEAPVHIITVRGIGYRLDPIRR